MNPAWSAGERALADTAFLVSAGMNLLLFAVSMAIAPAIAAYFQSPEALPVLQDLHARRRKHPQVLELLARCYRELGEWDELQALIPALRKADVLDDEQLQALREELARLGQDLGRALGQTLGEARGGRLLLHSTHGVQ